MDLLGHVVVFPIGWLIVRYTHNQFPILTVAFIIYILALPFYVRFHEYSHNFLLGSLHMCAGLKWSTDFFPVEQQQQQLKQRHLKQKDEPVNEKQLKPLWERSNWELFIHFLTYTDPAFLYDYIEAQRKRDKARVADLAKQGRQSSLKMLRGGLVSWLLLNAVMAFLPATTQIATTWYLLSGWRFWLFIYLSTCGP
jgi:hypothetical protein